MPTLHPTPETKILVTGVNGFFALWAARRLLERGYSVRGTVRSEAKGAYIKKYFESYREKFELAYVEDFTKEGAFDESLVGVHGVLHVATPIPSGDLVEPDDFVKPAVGGTLGILHSAQKSHYRTSVKRVVYTSTSGTLSGPVYEPTLISEKDWNNAAVQILEEKGIEAPNITKYIASKVLAEKAAWEFYEKNKDTLGYDFVTLLPPWILGPPIHELGPSPSSMGNSSYGYWYNIVVGNPTDPRKDETLEEVHGWVDVRDLADAHVTALEKGDAGGERITVAAGRASWQEWIDTTNKVLSLSTDISISHDLPKGKPGIKPKELYIYDTSKEARILGTGFRGIEKTARDALSVFAGRGW
ncbi:D-lactaldehyde dehydrogenase [Cyathus striatus]|nr:D-lactaldehyde dehydrogenase [Cyathus striatus]